MSILLDWQVPRHAVFALLMRPMLENRLVSEKELMEAGCPSCTEPVANLMALCERVSTSESARFGVRRVQGVLKLRHLFAEAYRSWEGTLCVLAEYLARVDTLDTLPGRAKYYLAEELQVVCLPLLELLGMWQYRRDVGDLCLQILKPGLYIRLEALIDSGREENSRLYRRIEKKLKPRLANMSPNAQMRFHQNRPSSVYRRMSPGQPREALTRQLKIDVLLPSIQDCYEAIALVHYLWPSSVGRFRDRISNPKFNGYRGLRTWISVPDLAGETHSIEFRILTQQIEAINSRGLVSALYQDSTREHVQRAWWEDRALSERVSSMEIGSLSGREVLVFSPMGEVKILPGNSTPIDYAFSVHTDLAVHSKRISVNGDAVDSSYRLRHGDIIHVEFDPHYTGPNPRWLETVQTRTAQTAIKRALSPPRTMEHKGRSVIMDILQREEGIYGFELSPKKLDNFLEKTRRRLKYQSTEALYADVATGKQSPDRIVRRLIAQELVRGVSTPKGEHLPVPEDRVWFARCGRGSSACQRDRKNCRVLPGDPIVGKCKQLESKYQSLIVHKRDCPKAPKGNGVVDLTWRFKDAREAATVTILAWDTPKLLGTILDQAYALYGEGLYVHAVSATSNPEQRSAKIVMTVDAPSHETLYHLSSKLKALEQNGTINDSAWMGLTPAERLKLKARASQDSQNPYSESVARGTMFVGRAKEQERILQALEGRTNFFVLHGEKRVGKTSLLRRLQTLLLQQRGYLPMLADLRHISRFEVPDLLTQLVKLLNEDIAREVFPDRTKMGLPQLNPKRLRADPFGELQGYFDRLRRRFPNRRPVMMLDEFNVLDLAEREGKLEPTFFNKLRYLVERRDDLGFILAIQEVAYRTAVRGHSGGWQALQSGSPIPLDYLDPVSAARLIREPKRNVLLYDDELVAEMLELTQSHPYFLQVICSRVVSGKLAAQTAVGGQRPVNRDDLQEALVEILKSGNLYFHHFLELAVHQKGHILVALAELSARGSPWVSVSEAYDMCHQLGRRLQQKKVRKWMKEMCYDRILLDRSDSRELRYRIRIPLFERWLHEEYRL
jgi:GTP pyrophosphokinase